MICIERHNGGTEVATVLESLINDPDLQDAWCAWVKRHGINPEDVPLPGKVVRDHANLCVTYTAVVRDTKGQPITCGDGVVTEERTVYLGRVPEPFPEVTP